MRFLKTFVIAVIAACSAGASGYTPGVNDYAFPSPRPPANRAAADVKQYVVFTFEDNGYSGATGTQCEMDSVPDVFPYPAIGDAGLPTQGQVGLYWAFSTFAATAKTNPDASPIHCTFNMITGLPVPVWGLDWQHRQSKFGGYFDPTNMNYPSASYSCPRAWGREMQIGMNQNGSDVQPGWVVPAWKALIVAGHEIGNHSIDHMEPNSPLPNLPVGFGQWAGEGFDPGPDLDFEGVSETDLYGLEANAWAQNNGWELNAGAKISTAAWQGAIELAEDQLTDPALIAMNASTVYGFSAPRGETNNKQFFALKAAGYQYDCGLEHDYLTDYAEIGTDAWWPYTTDNGIPGGKALSSTDHQLSLDSLPSQLWVIPRQPVIVPQALRPAIYRKHRQINNGSADGDDSLKYADYAMRDSTEWCGTGPTAGIIECRDYTMFILWGMTKAEWVSTMVANLRARMAAGKAPLQVACNGDFFTPIYDNMVLRTEWNRVGTGLVVSQGWNTWITRKEALEAFRDSCTVIGAHIVSGHELIEKVKAMQATDVAGAAHIIASGSWTSSNAGVLSGTLDNGTMALVAGSASVFYHDFSDSAITALDHISLSYTTNAALKLILVDSSSGRFEVLLNNLGPAVASGKIPVSAFRPTVDNPSAVLDVRKIASLYVMPFWTGTNKTAQFSVSNVNLYGSLVAAGTPVVYKGDFDNNGVIDVADFTQVASYWNLSHSGADTGFTELAPATGTVPNITVNPDGVFDYQDLFMFARLCRWSDVNQPLPPLPHMAPSLAKQSAAPVLSAHLSSGDSGRSVIAVSGSNLLNVASAVFECTGSFAEGQASWTDGDFLKRDAETFGVAQEKNGRHRYMTVRLSSTAPTVSGRGILASLTLPAGLQDSIGTDISYALLNAEGTVVAAGVLPLSGVSATMPVTAAPKLPALRQCGNIITVSIAPGAAQNLSLQLYNLSGRLVSVLAQGTRSPGDYSFDLHAGLAGGMYLLKVKSDAGEITQRAIVR